ncbi:dUTP diphosphatase [Nannocystis radixulma]|uniref:Deoxyuridine 5'-triphosphate nucleotidohydrolase n=1 Tax=Nannocystis radixulma TaxID=2995305 RepID=A0ABT5BIQ3_9BACT|nr:dUTP diphosphatase [Nannocystis radixulma]MDC0674036.1 dUTP diphosphatase [Nannocystis radixulma]
MSHVAPTLLVRKVHPDAQLPARMSADAAGMDLAACLPTGPIELAPGERRLIPTGVAVAIPAGHEGQVRPRSGLALKHGLSIVNAPGTIDADYRGELKVILVNLGAAPFVVAHGERIAQLVVAPVVFPAVVEVSDLPAAERGEGGFGSTGV